MVDLYLGVSVLTGLSFLKVISILDPRPVWLWTLAGVPVFLIARNFIVMWRGGDVDPKTLEGLCRNGLLTNLTIALTLTLQQTLT